MRYSRFTKGRPARGANCALRIFDAATICIALVICAVLLMERIRLRRSRGLFIRHESRFSKARSVNQTPQNIGESVAASSPGFLELVDCPFHSSRQLRTECLFARNVLE